MTKPIEFSVFRSWDFEAAVFVVIAAETYDVVGGFEISGADIRSRAADDNWVKGMRWTPSMNVLRSIPAVVDVTERLHAALLELP